MWICNVVVYTCVWDNLEVTAIQYNKTTKNVCPVSVLYDNLSAAVQWVIKKDTIIILYPNAERLRISNEPERNTLSDILWDNIGWRLFVNGPAGLAHMRTKDAYAAYICNISIGLYLLPQWNKQNQSTMNTVCKKKNQ